MGDDVPRARARTRSRRSTCWSAPTCARCPTRTLGMGSNSASNGTSRNANVQRPQHASSSRRSAGCRPTAWRTARRRVNLLTPGSLYGDRITQVDMRFAKIVRFGRRRARHRHRSLQPVQHQAIRWLHRDVRLRDQRRDLHAAERDRRAAVRAVQRDGSISKDGGFRLTTEDRRLRLKTPTDATNQRRDVRLYAEQRFAVRSRD